MAERKLFGTDGVRGLANVYPLDAATMQRAGMAAAKVFAGEKKRPVFVIGRDTRVSGEIIEAALVSGLCAMGADVKLIGILPTPAVAVAVRQLGADAGVVITASHNPAEDNGIKFFSAGGVKLPDEKELEIEQLILAGQPDTSHVTGAGIGRVERVGFDAAFADFLVNTAPAGALSGLKLVLDCANGAASFVAKGIFERLGAEVVIVNNEPDGLNINAGCGAMHPENSAKYVLEHNADLGITFDGDADRLIAIDEKGNVVDGDITIYLLALEHKASGNLDGDTVVVTAYTNLAIDAALKGQGISTARVANGDRYVIEEMLKKGYALGGEKSGHIILGKHNHTGDGILSGIHFAKMVKDSGRPLSELAGGVTLNPQVISKVEVANKVPLEEIAGYNKLAAEVGKRLGSTGRLFVRYSGTQNVCRVMVEGPELPILKEINEQVCAVIAAGTA
ncbi:MAG: phosphoglucosamine mutase [Phycisphaerae bacterium]|jgi:phosphoglucosamine mutase